MKLAQDSTGADKAWYMMVHKSIGVSLLAAIGLRLGVRARAKIPKIPWPEQWYEKAASSASHAGLYGLMLFMPISGVTMGYFGGKGIPFFGLYTVPGAEEPTKSIAGSAFKYHKLAGQALEVLVPIHIGAVGVHLARGHKILQRMIPGL